jgi:hypothetical protein
MVENTRLSFASQRLQHVVDGSGGVQFGSFGIDSCDRVLIAHCLYLCVQTNGGARPPENVVVGTRYIYTRALALVGLALATCAILFLMIDF